MQDGGRVDIPIHEGEMLLLPPRVPHSPQRYANTVGLVIERQRRPEEQDGFLWYCEHCQYPLYAEYLHVSDIEKQLPPIFERFYGSPAEPHVPGVRHRRTQALSDERFVATPTPALTVEIAGRRWRVGTQGRDISIPLEFDAAQPKFFGAPPAAAAVIAAGSFVGDVQRGGSCNCSTLHADSTLQRHAHRVRRARDGGAAERSRSQQRAFLRGTARLRRDRHL